MPVANQGVYACIELRMNFQRDISNIIQEVYIPTSFVVCISFLSFFIDYRSAAARAPLGVTSILTITKTFEGRAPILDSFNKKNNILT